MVRLPVASMAACTTGCSLVFLLGVAEGITRSLKVAFGSLGLSLRHLDALPGEDECDGRERNQADIANRGAVRLASVRLTKPDPPDHTHEKDCCDDRSLAITDGVRPASLHHR